MSSYGKRVLSGAAVAGFVIAPAVALIGLFHKRTRPAALAALLIIAVICGTIFAGGIFYFSQNPELANQVMTSLQARPENAKSAGS